MVRQRPATLLARVSNATGLTQRLQRRLGRRHARVLRASGGKRMNRWFGAPVLELEGLTRHAGKHAAGIVISEGPLWDHVPVFKDGKTDGYITQYYKDDVEQAGLVKFDFLGLKTLTVIDIAVRLIRERPDLQKVEQPSFTPANERSR